MSEQNTQVPETVEQLEKRLQNVLILIQAQQARLSRATSPGSRFRIARHLGSLEMARLTIVDKLALLPPE